jgi:arabinan endo-1,5-alpha-L-arabinosidase
MKIKLATAAKNNARRALFRNVGLMLLLLAAGGVRAEATYAPLPLTGDTFIHDPSTIVPDGGKYYIFGTKLGIETKFSSDLIDWTEGKPVFAAPPEWTTNRVPEFKGHFWAPDVIHINGKYYLYFAVSTMGKQLSAIGLATSPTLDQSATNYAWTDCGPVITSRPGMPFNTIDPSVFLDRDGKLWLAFGSYWQGIYLTELDPKTGLRPDDAPLHRLAWNDSIEATCLTRHDDYYYLFVNWGSCCQGTNSTYEIRVGRSKVITGPYLDRDGKDLVAKGGSLFLKVQGKYFGPGHVGILRAKDADWFSYHYYDAETQGKSRLAIGHLRWTADGWPEPGD